MRVASKWFAYCGAALLLVLLVWRLTQTRWAASDDVAFWRSFTSGSAQVGQMQLHYVTAGSGDVVVLLHGWPQTWFEWREIMPGLAERYRVIAADLPGLGDSEVPAAYDKRTLAQHLHQFIAGLKITSFHLVGHDFGGTVAYAYARQFPADVKTVVVVDAPIPGLAEWNEVRSQWPRWHFAFHNLPELPEALVSGREKVYLSWFYQTLAYKKSVFSEARIDRYVQAYSNASSLHAGFEYYRALEKDAADNKDYESNKLTMPVLALGAENSRLNKYVIDQLRAATTKLTGDLVPQSGHWIPEEQPEWLTKRLIAFFTDNSL